MVRTLALCGFAIALASTFTLVAAAQSSCSAENSLCLSRGGGGFCAQRMAKCKRNGCWEHLPKYGGRICNLKKS